MYFHQKSSYLGSLLGMEWTLFASLFYFPITDRVTALWGVVSVRIGHIHAGVHSLLSKRQKIDSPKNITWFAMANWRIERKGSIGRTVIYFLPKIGTGCANHLINHHAPV